MIPKGGAAFLTPFFGNWAGKDDMTKYFLRDTPLAGLERQMMTPPNFSPRGGGQTVLCRFRYRPEDVVCKHCTEYRRGGCTEEVCPWLEERVEAGTVTYTSLAAEFYRKWLGTALGERIQELLRGKRSIAYYDSAHTDRLALYALFLARHRSDHRALAAMYLLTATETLRRCAIPRIFDLWGIDIRSWSAVRTLSEQEYVLFQAAKGSGRARGPSLFRNCVTGNWWKTRLWS